MKEDGEAETGEEKVAQNQLQQYVNIWASLNTANEHAPYDDFLHKTSDHRTVVGFFKQVTVLNTGCVCCYSTL